MREVGTLDAPTLRRAMALYAQALEAHREEIDSLNVFPVPDGDTGTNMLLTQRAVDEACAGLDGAPIGTLGDTMARAALLGARGSSGVILSQILRGLTEGLDGASGVRWGEVGAIASPEAAAVILVRALEPDGAELLTLYLGEGVSDEEGERVAAALRESQAHLEIEVQRGDQPGSAYLIGME